jgi:hypothetical protein
VLQVSCSERVSATTRLSISIIGDQGVGSTNQSLNQLSQTTAGKLPQLATQGKVNFPGVAIKP